MSGARYFFFNDTATTEIYTLSLHDALPISSSGAHQSGSADLGDCGWDESQDRSRNGQGAPARSEEHTSELQSRQYLVCRLLLEKKIVIVSLTMPDFVATLLAHVFSATCVIN